VLFQFLNLLNLSDFHQVSSGVCVTYKNHIGPTFSEKSTAYCMSGASGPWKHLCKGRLQNSPLPACQPVSRVWVVLWKVFSISWLMGEASDFLEFWGLNALTRKGKSHFRNQILGRRQLQSQRGCLPFSQDFLCVCVCVCVCNAVLGM
jgi:hypothetical protein